MMGSFHEPWSTPLRIIFRIARFQNAKCNKLQPNEIIFRFSLLLIFEAIWLFQEMQEEEKARKKTRTAFKEISLEKPSARRRRRETKRDFLTKFKILFIPRKKYPHKSSCDLLKKIKCSALEGGKMLEERRETSDGFKEVFFILLVHSRQSLSFALLF